MYFLLYIDMYVIGTTIIYQLFIVTEMVHNNTDKTLSDKQK